MKTKDRILDTAIRLFNERGTNAVSTNHIAEEMGMSPGNLYYHFKNKEEIIRMVFERLFQLWDVTFALPEDRSPTVEDVQALVRANFAIMYDYRFVYREIIALLQQDNALHERYIAIRQRGFDGFQEIFLVLGNTGVLSTPADPTVVTRLAELCWLISEFWLASVEVNGQSVSEERMQHGITLMMQLLQPYLI